MTATAWGDVLDAFEARLDAQEATLDDGTLDVVPTFDPPGMTAVLPEEDVERALTLLWRCRALEERIADRLAATREDLERASASAPAGSPAEPVYFDSRV